MTANYKLSFDTLRQELPGLNCWILVVDTRGINVWCAGGKGTFSSEEVAFQVQKAKIESIVTHKKLILPQLSANGVALHKLKELCGFRGEFGPIKASDIKEFLSAGKSTEKMQTVTFNIAERAVLIPLEICILWKQLLFVTLFCFIISGISGDFYNIDQALTRGTGLTLATLIAIFSGAVVTPLLLPWIPVRQFWIKGVITGGITSVLFTGLLIETVSTLDSLAIIIWVLGCSSYLAMNFTGSTVFTSLSGVEKEMRSGLVFQITATTLALIIWLISPFISYL